MTRAPSRVHAAWAGEHRFDTGRPGGPLARLDGSGESGQSPPDALLSALAACSGVDVVDILAKRRTPVERMTIEVEGERRDDMPRRFIRLRITFRVDGAGIETTHAERAVALAFEKYCSVAASLAHDIVVETIVVVNGASAEAVVQPTRLSARLAPSPSSRSPDP
ncbi:MAG TPA: OsmC family protein [Gemmatimonadaceae bacterium]|nr:OsmC family protein [Gemmatimonadaceae bacterium]